MNRPASSFTVDVDLTNPGQFFACCGLLELAHRLWSDTEVWFDTASGNFAIAANGASAGMERIFCALGHCDISGLTEEERRQRDALEKKYRPLRKQKKSLPPEEEAQRKKLGENAREGVLRIGDPFKLLLNWWRSGDEETPKTWAGKQEIHKVARAAQEALCEITNFQKAFDYACVLRLPQEYRKNSSPRKKVEPFYFDARRFTHALDTGWSLDVQSTETVAHPAVELLCLVGLQRFRPSFADKHFSYRTWSYPLAAPLAAAIVGGAIPISGCQYYRFRMRFRDDQKRYKAFDFATRRGDQE